MSIDPVSERRKELLRIVVQEYVDTALPVGSQAIADKYNLGVSSATIRNDMAALERDGLLTHPHTSAGRVPTDAGYRYFVRHLVPDMELPSSERRMIRHQFHQSRREIDQWLRLSTAVLSQASHAAALATTPRAVHSRIKHLELIGIRDAVVLLVLVLEEGAVKQQIVSLDGPVTQDELSQTSNELNEHFGGADVTRIATRLPLLSPLAQDVAVLLADMMKRLDGTVGERIYRDGLAQILEAPEFAEGENVRRVVRVMEQRSVLEEILGELVELNDVQVLIAGEGRFVELQDISLVLTQYGIENQVTGMIGVIGPLRMPYGRTIGAVRYVAALMSDLMQQYYGSQ
ncbi:MAG: heat-inducible transcription repressor HrcA [Caldilineaceae bacterium]|nr:heat-inducible transcription repressor HrcA [Caldilineaceae bacterium]HRJ41093.1 heat-inducible transcriptional repressor HrcA [Caldilineaceae bacterium]